MRAMRAILAAKSIRTVRSVAATAGYYWLRPPGADWRVLRLTAPPRLWIASLDPEDLLTNKQDRDLVGWDIIGPIEPPD